MIVRWVWVVIPLLILSIGISTNNVEATQCIPISVRIEDVGLGDDGIPKWIDNERSFKIGKDTIIITGKIVSLVDRIQTIHLGIISNNVGKTYSQTCSIPQNIFETFGDDGKHFEIVSDQFKTLTLQPGEVIPLEMELRPLKSGNYTIHLITHTPAFDKTHPYFPISPFYEQVTITGNDVITMYDVIFVGLFSVVGIGIFVTGFLVLRKWMK